MRTEFVRKLLIDLIDRNEIDKDAPTLAVCAGTSEKDLFVELGFSDVTISNLDDRIVGDEFKPCLWSRQDAQRLTFPDNSFSLVFVADGLHHCQSPHRALTEMYRVSRGAILVVESRESFLMRLANRFGLSPEYELEAVAIHGLTHGGVDNSHVPNFIYRWKEREVEKTLRSYDPAGDIKISYFYGLDIPFIHARARRSPLKLMVITVLRPIIWLFTFLFPKQGNTFAFLAIRDSETWPWMSGTRDTPEINRDYMSHRFRIGNQAATRYAHPSGQHAS